MSGENIENFSVAFEADIDDLQKGVAKIQSILSTQLTAGLNEAGKTSQISGGKIKGAFRDVAQAISVVGVAVGGQAAQFTILASTAVSSLGSVGKTMTGLVGGPVAITVAAIAALVAVVVLAATHWDTFSTTVRKVWNQIVSVTAGAIDTLFTFLSKLPFVMNSVVDGYRAIAISARDYKSNADRQIDAINAQADALKKTADALKKYKDTLTALNSDFSKATISEKLFGQSLATTEEKLALTKKTMIELREQQLAAANESDKQRLANNITTLANVYADLQKTVARFKSSGVFDDFRKDMQSISLAQAKFGTTSDLLKQKVDLAKDSLVQFVAEGGDPTSATFSKMAAAVTSAQAELQKFQGRPLSDYIAQEESPQVLGDKLEQSKQQFAAWIADLSITQADFYELVQGTVNTLTAGIGTSVANAIIYSQDLATALMDTLKRVGASIISFLVEILAKQLIYFVLKAAGLIADTGVTLGAYAKQTFAGAFASVISGLPFPANIIAAPIVATAAVGTMLAGASLAGSTGKAAGVTGLAEGGLVTGPGLFILGENRLGNPEEVVAPRSQFEELFKGNDKTQVIGMYLDGRVIARSVVKNLPDEIRVQGVRT